MRPGLILSCKESKEKCMPKTVSAFQFEVLDLMARGNTLSNDHEGEGAPYRPANGMFSGWIMSNSRSLCIPYRTIGSMLKAGHIEEAHRSTHTGH
jgi:hypothetical protein